MLTIVNICIFLRFMQKKSLQHFWIGYWSCQVIIFQITKKKKTRHVWICMFHIMYFELFNLSIDFCNFNWNQKRPREEFPSVIIWVISFKTVHLHTLSTQAFYRSLFLGLLSVQSWSFNSVIANELFQLKGKNIFYIPIILTDYIVSHLIPFNN